MKLPNPDTHDIAILDLFRNHIPEEWLPTVLSALRQDRAVWNALRDPVLRECLAADLPEEPQAWTPAYIGLLALEADFSPADLRTEPAFIVDEIYLARRADHMDSSNGDSSWGHKSPVEVMASATRLALRLRSDLPTDQDKFPGSILGQQSSSLVGTAFAVLYDLLGDSYTWLSSLLSETPDSTRIALVLHCLASNPLGSQLQRDSLFGLIQNHPLRVQLAVLHPLRTRLPDLASAVAHRLYAKQSAPSRRFLRNGGYALVAELECAELAALAGFNDQARERYTRIAQETTSLQADLSARIAMIREITEPGSLKQAAALDDWAKANELAKHEPHYLARYALALSQNGELAKVDELLPASTTASEVLYAKAVIAWNRPDPDPATAMLFGKQAADRLQSEERRSSPEHQAYILELSRFLIDIHLPAEAGKVLRLAFETQPDNIEILSLIGRASRMSHNFETSLAALRLASGLAPLELEILDQLILTLEAAGDWNDALIERSKRLERIESPSIEELQAFAYCALRAGEPEIAIQIGEQALLTDPSNGPIHAVLGEAHYGLGDKTKAIELLKNATQLSPTENLSWLALARVQRHSGAPHRAMETLRTASHACPNAPAIHVELGKAHLDAGSPTKALPNLRKAAELETGNPATELLLGQTLNLLGHHEEAAQVLSVTYQSVPGISEVALAYADSLVAIERWRDALAPLSGLVHSGTPEPDAYFDYALALLSLNEGVSDAIVALDHYLEHRAEDIRALALKAEARLALGEHERADSLYQQLLEADLDREPTWRIRILVGVAKTALASGSVERAIAVLNDAAGDEPEEPQLYATLSEAYAEAGLRENALVAARNALSRDAQSLEMLTWFAENAIDLGAVSEAYGALRQALELAPARTDLLVLLAKVQLQGAEQEEAQETLKQLFASADASPEELCAAAEILIAIKDPWMAGDCLEAAIARSDQQTAGYLKLLSTAYRQQGEINRALETIDEAIRTEPDDTHLYLEKVSILTDENRHQAALACIEQALQLKPQDLELLQAAIHVHRLIGDHEIALELAERRLRMDPESLILRQHAAELARSLLQFSYAERILGKDWPGKLIGTGTDSLQSTTLGDLLPYFCLKAEIYILLDDEPAAAEALKEAIRIDGGSRRALANLAVLHASNDRLQEAEDLVQRIWPSSEQTDSPQAALMPDRSTLLALTDAAAKIGRYAAGLKLIGELRRSEPLDPYVNLQYARLVVLQAEEWRTCAALDIRAHRPENTSISEPSRHRFEKAIALAEQQLKGGRQPSALTTWKARGKAIFQPDASNIPDLRSLKHSAKNQAALIAALGLLGDLEGVREAAQPLSTHPEVAFQTAIALRQLMPGEALRHAKLVADQRPDDPRTLALVAQLAGATADHEQAIEAMEAALMAWPEETSWHVQAARWIEEMHQKSDPVALQSAVSHLEIAADLDSEDVECRLQLGRLLLRIQESGRALNVLEDAAGLAGADHDIHLALADAYRNEGRIDEAAASIEAAMDLAPDDVRPYQLHAALALEQGSPQDALDRVSAALRISAEDPESYRIQAKAYEKLKRPSEALEAVQKALSHARQPLTLLLDRIRLLEAARGRPAAVTALQELAEGYPTSAEVQKRLADMLLHENRPAEAIKAAQQALHSGSDTLSQADLAELHILLGRLLRRTGQQDQAIQHLSAAVKMESVTLEPYLELGRTYVERRELDEAVNVYQKAIEQSPEDPRPYYQAGLALKERKDYLEAEEMLRRAAELLPSDLSIHRQLGAVVALNIVHNHGKATIEA